MAGKGIKRHRATCAPLSRCTFSNRKVFARALSITGYYKCVLLLPSLMKSTESEPQSGGAEQSDACWNDFNFQPILFALNFTVSISIKYNFRKLFGTRATRGASYITKVDEMTEPASCSREYTLHRQRNVHAITSKTGEGCVQKLVK